MDAIAHLPYIRTMTSTTPTLVEPKVSEYYNMALKHCHTYKIYYYTLIYNGCLFVLFLVITIIVLYWKYKGKRTPEELEADNAKKKEYILSKIKMIDIENQRIQQQLITGLPHF